MHNLPQTGLSQKSTEFSGNDKKLEGRIMQKVAKYNSPQKLCEGNKWFDFPGNDRFVTPYSKKFNESLERKELQVEVESCRLLEIYRHCSVLSFLLQIVCEDLSLVRYPGSIASSESSSSPQDAVNADMGYVG